MVLVVVAVLVSIIIYRVAILAVLNRNDSFRSSATYITTITAAVIQLAAIQILNWVSRVLSIYCSPIGRCG